MSSYDYNMFSYDDCDMLRYNDYEIICDDYYN